MGMVTSFCRTGLAKNTTRIYTLFALANLYLVRKNLGAQQVTCLC